ncbi:hypothetical protein EYC80_007147 [Monilinia laxa]|uniref:Uncharacterized protein n=1 Tax=Monilinia laxa TaxID=61186 RepID=A0A5N6K0C5_MONLA|nr:hypothetical protein EYC80_007147 [Monilinia laxa]
MLYCVCETSREYSDSSQRPSTTQHPTTQQPRTYPPNISSNPRFSDTTAYICHFHSYRNYQSTNIPINRNHGKGSRIPRSCRKGQVSNTKGTILLIYFSKDGSIRRCPNWWWRIRIRQYVGRMEMGNSKRVEPQEKKKRPKGRAAKREKFTRRFVNVTLTGGKRKVR